MTFKEHYKVHGLLFKGFYSKYGEKHAFTLKALDMLGTFSPTYKKEGKLIKVIDMEGYEKYRLHLYNKQKLKNSIIRNVLANLDIDINEFAANL